MKHYTRRIRLASLRKAGRVIPRRPRGLRAAVVILAPGDVMEWHSTGAREELLIALGGRVAVDVDVASRGRRRVALASGHSLFLPHRTRHRVINRSSVAARYLYITAPVR